MPRDLRQLLHDTADEPAGEADVDRLVRRGRRRRRVRHATAGLGAAAAVLVGLLVATSPPTEPSPPPIVDQPPPGTPSDAAPTPSPTTDGGQDTTESEIDALPVMGDVGVAVDVGGAVAFVGADGVEHTRLEGWTINRGAPGRLVSGPILLSERDAARSVWVAPATGAIRDQDEEGERLWAPMSGVWEVVDRPSTTDPSPVHLVSSGETIASFSVMGPHGISDGHAAVSWADCPADAGTDGSKCAWRAHNIDMGGDLELPAGCQVADTFADFNVLLSCSRSWEQADGRVWLERQGPAPDQNRQVEAFAADGWFANAFLAGDQVVATWEDRQPEGDGCRARQVVHVPSGATTPAMYEPAADAGSAMVIGTVEDAAVVVQTDASCFGDEPAAGQVRLIRPDGDDALLYDGPMVTAELWNGVDVASQEGQSDAGAASQSAADAQRDGVLAEVAALTFDQRVEVRQLATAGQRVRAETDEGVWVVSRLPAETNELADGCGLGATDDPNAVYRRDVICTVEYGEILLLNHAEDEILRAFPLPGLPPEQLAIADEAVWCGRQGDGGLPDGVLCRIDRQTFDWQVRVFPHRTSTAFSNVGDAGSGVDPATGELWVPDHWTVEQGPVRHSQSYLAGRWTFEGPTLVASSQGALRYDPATLAPIPPCDVDVTTDTVPSDNAVTLTTTITLVTGEPCGFDPHVGHQVHDADGWPLTTEGLASQPTQAVLRPGEPLQINARWTNWCGEQDPYEVIVEAGPFGQWRSPVTAAPACEDPSAPSRLEATPGS